MKGTAEGTAGFDGGTALETGLGLAGWLIACRWLDGLAADLGCETLTRDCGLLKSGLVVGTRAGGLAEWATGGLTDGESGGGLDVTGPPCKPGGFCELGASRGAKGFDEGADKGEWLPGRPEAADVPKETAAMKATTTCSTMAFSLERGHEARKACKSFRFWTPALSLLPSRI